MIISLLLLATLHLRNRSRGFCSTAKGNLRCSAISVLRKCQAFVAVLQRSHCKTALLVLQDGRTGSLSSKSVIKECDQRVFFKGSVSTPPTVEVVQ